MIMDTSAGGARCIDMDTSAGGARCIDMDTSAGGARRMGMDTSAGGARCIDIDTSAGGARRMGMDTSAGGARRHKHRRIEEAPPERRSFVAASTDGIQNGAGKQVDSRWRRGDKQPAVCRKLPSYSCFAKSIRQKLKREQLDQDLSLLTNSEAVCRKPHSPITSREDGRCFRGNSQQ